MRMLASRELQAHLPQAIRPPLFPCGLSSCSRSYGPSSPQARDPTIILCSTQAQRRPVAGRWSAHGKPRDSAGGAPPQDYLLDRRGVTRVEGPLAERKMCRWSAKGAVHSTTSVG